MAQPATHNDDQGAILALDVGVKRIGVAVASPVARIARPLRTILNDETVIAELTKLVQQEGAGRLVVGLPRNLDGDDTGQTAIVREFALSLETALHLPVIFQDEALTSVKAESELAARGKPFAKGDIDALAATYILSDYLESTGSTA